MSGLPVFKPQSRLRDVAVAGVGGIENLDIFQKCESLQSISMWACSDLRNVEALSLFRDLASLEFAELLLDKQLDLSSFDKLIDLRLISLASVNSDTILGVSGSLESIVIERCPAVLDLDGLAAQSNIRKISLSNLPKIGNIDCMTNMDKLTHLELTNCDGIEHLNQLRGLDIEELHLAAMDGIVDFSGISELRNLRMVSFYSCDNLKDLSFLSDLSQLEAIWLGPVMEGLSIPEHLRPKVAVGPFRKPFWPYGYRAKWRSERWTGFEPSMIYHRRRAYALRNATTMPEPYFEQDLHI